MLSLPAAMRAAFLPFAPLFSRPVWRHVQVVLVGAVLDRGPRTVTAVLRVMGLGHEQRCEKYPRVLSRARWSGLQGAKILLGFFAQRPNYVVHYIIEGLSQVPDHPKFSPLKFLSASQLNILRLPLLCMIETCDPSPFPDNL